MTDPYAPSTDPGRGESPDPWSSGPGLGSDPSPDPGAGAPTPAGYPPPASYPAPGPSEFPQPGDVAAAPQPTAPSWPSQPPGPTAQTGYPQPAPPASYQQPPYATYPEPEAGPFGGTGYSPYAQSAYAGQNLPAISDPVAYDYGYGRPPMGGATHPQATTSMVLGILGLVAFSPLAPVAWYLAAKARREMAAEPQRWQPSGMVTAGYVLGIVGTMILGLFTVFIVLAFMLAAFSAF